MIEKKIQKVYVKSIPKKMVGILLVPDDARPAAGSVLFYLDKKSGHTFIGVPLYDKVEEDAKLNFYTSTIESSFVEAIPVTNETLRKAGFNICYVDEEGKLNGKEENTAASLLCGASLVGRAMLVKEPEVE